MVDEVKFIFWDVFEVDFYFFGFVGIFDLFRKEFVGVVVDCFRVGIIFWMLIGDYFVIVIVIVFNIGIFDKIYLKIFVMIG